MFRPNGSVVDHDERPGEQEGRNGLLDALSRVDPVPSGLDAQLEKMFRRRRQGAELARLVPDDADGTVSADAPFRLRFEADRCAIDVVVSPDPSGSTSRLDLRATVRGASPTAGVAETPATTIDAVIEGATVHVQGLDHGPVRLVLVMEGDADPWTVESEWATL